MKHINTDYIAKAKNLSEEDRERLLSRMGGKLPKRLQKEKLTVEEAIAIQLELEEEQLQEWRANMAVIEEKAAKLKAKADEKAAKAKAKEVPANVTKPAVTKAAPAKKPSPAAKPAATTKAPATPALKK
jgi:septal ring factor EnvC (AmiA/AmiB activator)